MWSGAGVNGVGIASEDGVLTWRNLDLGTTGRAMVRVEVVYMRTWWIDDGITEMVLPEL